MRLRFEEIERLGTRVSQVSPATGRSEVRFQCIVTCRSELQFLLLRVLWDLPIELGDTRRVTTASFAPVLLPCSLSFSQRRFIEGTREP